MANPKLPRSPFGNDPTSRASGWRQRLGWLAVAAAGLAVVGWKLFQPRPTVPPASPPPEPPPEPAEEEEEVHYADGRIEHPRVRRETRDVRVGVLFGIIIGLACLFAIHISVVWWYFWWLAGAQAVQKESPYPLAPKLSARLPSRPRLEQIQFLAGDTSGLVAERLAAEEKVLRSYGATDDKDFVHIPIEQAMRLAAPRLAVRKEPPSAVHDQGLLDGGEPNSGHVFAGGRP